MCETVFEGHENKAVIAAKFMSSVGDNTMKAIVCGMDQPFSALPW